VSEVGGDRARARGPHGPDATRMPGRESTIIVLRHALAGAKDPDPGRDAARRLDEEGRATAVALPAVLRGYRPPSELLSSPHVRCTETLVPLCERLGLPVETREALGPDSGYADAVDLLLGAADDALLCTHGEVIARVFDGLDCEKGGFWVVRRRGGALEPVRYMPPPRVAVRAGDDADRRR
jgi:phosphohistidine phosphatase SixA